MLLGMAQHAQLKPSLHQATRRNWPVAVNCLVCDTLVWMPRDTLDDAVRPTHRIQDNTLRLINVLYLSKHQILSYRIRETVVSPQLQTHTLTKLILKPLLSLPCPSVHWTCVQIAHDTPNPYLRWPCTSHAKPCAKIERAAFTRRAFTLPPIARHDSISAI